MRGRPDLLKEISRKATGRSGRASSSAAPAAGESRLALASYNMITT